MESYGWLSSLSAFALALVPGAVAVAAGVLAVAWHREREWAWFVLVVLGGLQLLSHGGLLLAGPSVAGLVGAGASAVLLVLALHPNSRARLDRPVLPARPPSWRARR